MSDIDLKGYASLSSEVNKQKGEPYPETKEGVVSDKLPELTLTMSDEDIIKLTNKWEAEWKNSAERQEWIKQIEENEKYWMGKHFDNPKADKNRPMVDNLIFESVETYLPQVTRRNPEALVEIDSSSIEEIPNPLHEKYIEKVKVRLKDLADKNRIRLKLKKAARHWSIYQLGVAKFGWDLDRDMPIVRIIRPTRIILDPKATIDEDGYTGNRIGEYRKMEANKILFIAEGEISDKAKEKIDELIGKDNEATEINFIEWWTPQYMCWKLGEDILYKKKNPHWNYDGEEEEKETDEYGVETVSKVETKGINHLPIPEMPYKFLSVFNLGDQPMDKTGLIQQNLSNQDIINKRNRQIDKNADRLNGGMVVSLERSGLTQGQAKGVSEALRKGGVVSIPSGSPRDAIDDYSPTPIPADLYNQLSDMRARLRDIFGTSGSTPVGIKEEKTVRGKIMSRGADTDRIGGGVSEYLEQFADDIYNWFVQLLYVYDTGFQFIEGAEPPKINISVKEGSLLPKDSASIANQALELAGMNRISNIDLYKRLEYPNPEELAANVWLEVNAPHLLYKDNPMVQQAIMMQQAQAQQELQQKNSEILLKRKGGKEGSILSEVSVATGGEPQ